MKTINEIANYNYKSRHIIILYGIGVILMVANAVVDKYFGIKSHGHVFIICVIFILAILHYCIGKYLKPIAQKILELENGKDRNIQ